MKRFEFRLERLERVRDVRRGQARQQLATALGALRGAQRRREDEARAAKDAAHHALPEALAADPRLLQQLESWREYRRNCLLEAARLEGVATQQVGVAAHRHTEAERALRVIERLRERRHAAWTEELQREEQGFFDEAALWRASRRDDTNDGTE